MAFCFRRRETIAAGFERIAHEQLRAGVAALEKNPDDGVHDARRTIKRLRGLLRLFRRALPGESFARANRDLRAAGHSLSAVRDARVRLEVFESVAKGMRDPAIAEFRESLVAAARMAQGGQTSRRPGAAAIAALHTVAARLPGLKADTGWRVLACGLEAAYRRARKAHAEARTEFSTEALHAWRRRSKDFQYQLQLLRKLDLPEIKRRIRKASHLTDLLGADHDLAALDRILARTSRIAARQRRKLRQRIVHRRDRLQRRAFDLGRELFFEKPSELVAEFTRAWKRGRR